MQKMLFLLFLHRVSYAQNNPDISSYSYGQKEMELISNSKKGTLIGSAFNAKKKIKEESLKKFIRFLWRIKSETIQPQP